MGKTFINWLQAYNHRHYTEYGGYVSVRFLDDETGCLMYDDEVIPNSSFEGMEELEYLLLNK